MIMFAAVNGGKITSRHQSFSVKESFETGAPVNGAAAKAGGFEG
jgi:hypothetical protein